ILGDRVHAYADVRDIEINNILFDWRKLNMPLYDLNACAGFQFLFKIDPQSNEKKRFDNRFRLNPVQLAETMELINTLAQTLQIRNPGFQFKAITLFHQLLLSLIMNYSHPESESGHSTIPHRLGELVGDMEKDCSRAFSIGEMCRRTCMSRAGLFRMFQRYFQKTPLNYLQDIRLEHAAQMLINTDLTISEIAAMTGFADGSYFTRKFRETNKVTPRDFRKIGVKPHSNWMSDLDSRLRSSKTGISKAENL
ncbi:MAG: AraC family transcriptional regulator, partial [Victivallales bacterium]